MNAFSNLFVIARVAGDQRLAVRKDIAEKFFKQIVAVAYLKKQHIS